MKASGLNSLKTKQTNRLGVLKLICTTPDISRTEITKKMGITKMTVSIIVNSLIKSGMVVETENKEPIINKGSNIKGAGRKQTGLKISQTAPLVIGMWVSRDMCSGVLSTLDLEKQVSISSRFSEDESENTVLGKIFEVISSLLKSAEKIDRQVIVIGVSAIGPLNAFNGMILNPPNFYSIENFEIVKKIEEKLDIPAFLQNDMNAGGIAEMHFGNCIDVSNFVYIGFSNGIGAGVISNGKLYYGASGFAGEIGHASINFEGPLCACGNKGCLEAYISFGKLFNKIHEKCGIKITTFKDFCELESHEDLGIRKKATGVIYQSLDLIITAMINFCNTLDPKVIILGHQAVYFTDNQIEYIEQGLNRGILSKGVNEIEIYRSAFGELSTVFGGVAVAIEKVFEGAIFYDEFFSEENKKVEII